MHVASKPACRMTCRPFRMFTVPSGTHVCFERRILPAARAAISTSIHTGGLVQSNSGTTLTTCLITEAHRDAPRRNVPQHRRCLPLTLMTPIFSCFRAAPRLAPSVTVVEVSSLPSVQAHRTRVPTRQTRQIKAMLGNMGLYEKAQCRSCGGLAEQAQGSASVGCRNDSALA